MAFERLTTASKLEARLHVTYPHECNYFLDCHEVHSILSDKYPVTPNIRYSAFHSSSSFFLFFFPFENLISTTFVLCFLSYRIVRKLKS